MTIREIAAIAGVSPAAVSLVINNKKGISAETRRHLQSIMEECGTCLHPFGARPTASA